MIFNDHSKLNGLHAILSPSNYHWLRYDDEKLIRVLENSKKAELGTRIHAYASEAIKLKRLQPDIQETVCMFVNDAIRYEMESEQVLCYSPYCFGTADAISFYDGLLRIHDLKTGDTKASMDQLIIYAGLFCLEYDVNPKKIDCEFRIYQKNEKKIYIPSEGEVCESMDIIVHANSIAEVAYGERR